MKLFIHKTNAYKCIYNKNMEDKDKRPKQVIVVRKDLVMPMGKLGAQIAHASLAPILNAMYISNTVDDSSTLNSTFSGYTERTLKVHNGSALQQWMDGPFVKVLLEIKSEAKLLELAEKVKERNIPCAVIKDVGYTVFTEPTVTCLGIGPCWPDEIDDLTKRLQTLKTYNFS